MIRFERFVLLTCAAMLVAAPASYGQTSRRRRPGAPPIRPRKAPSSGTARSADTFSGASTRSGARKRSIPDELQLPRRMDVTPRRCAGIRLVR